MSRALRHWQFWRCGLGVTTNSKAIQVYLPYLRGIIACVETDDLLYKGTPDPSEHRQDKR